MRALLALNRESLTEAERLVLALRKQQRLLIVEAHKTLTLADIGEAAGITKQRAGRILGEEYRASRVTRLQMVEGH